MNPPSVFMQFELVPLQLSMPNLHSLMSGKGTRGTCVCTSEMSFVLLLEVANITHMARAGAREVCENYNEKHRRCSK